jgi:carbamoyl-phosphate synthase large subunit
MGLRNTTVLMTGGGAPGAPGILECLKKDPSLSIWVGDADPNAVGRLLHPQFVEFPPASSPDFISRLLAICEERGIEVILPLVTRELEPLAKARPAFLEKGIRVLVSDPEAITLANNKARTLNYLKGKQIPVPRFSVVNSVEAFEREAKALGFPEEPFCFKPAEANGSRGFRVVYPELNEADLLFKEKPYQTAISYCHAVEILSSQPFPELILAEYLPGEEYSVDCLADRGNTVLAVPRLRSRMVNGISVKGCFVRDEAIQQYCATIIGAIGLHGNIGIQVRRNREGKPLLLEINPRVQGTIVAGLGAGINLPLLALKQEMGHPIDPESIRVKWGTSFSRYWTEVYG